MQPEKEPRVMRYLVVGGGMTANVAERGIQGREPVDASGLALIFS